MASLTTETCLLRIVADEFDSLGLVLDAVGGYRRVVRDLFDENVGFSASIEVRPVAVEEPEAYVNTRMLMCNRYALSKNRIERSEVWR